MNAIAVSPAGVPLGLCGQAWWARDEEVDERPVKSRLTEEKETKYWIEVMSAVSARFAAAGSDAPVPWFQLDRGADCWPVLVQARDRGTLVTVRSSSDRRLVDSGGKRQYLHATMEAQPPLGGYSLEVAGAGGRTGRTAKMVVRVAPVTLLMTDSRSSRHHECPVWCVWTIESGTTPPGEKPLNWMLLTTRPTDNFTDAKHVIFGYSMRWRVEEFHKAWKTGHCDVEDVQLRGDRAIRIWTTLHAAVAMRLLRMTYLAREQPTLPAADEFTEDEIHAVYLAKKQAWTGKAKPSIAKITLWIAELGGYFGKSVGPPGMIVLSRGWERVVPVAQALAYMRTVERRGIGK
jgi:hypothetical protein